MSRPGSPVDFDTSFLDELEQELAKAASRYDTDAIDEEIISQSANKAQILADDGEYGNFCAKPQTSSSRQFNGLPLPLPNTVLPLPSLDRLASLRPNEETDDSPVPRKRAKIDEVPQERDANNTSPQPSDPEEPEEPEDDSDDDQNHGPRKSRDREMYNRVITASQPPTALVDRVKVIMQHKNLRQKELAEEIGWSGSTLSQVLSLSYKHLRKHKHLEKLIDWCVKQDNMLFDQLWRFALANTTPSTKITPFLIASTLHVRPELFYRWLTKSLPLADRSNIDSLVRDYMTNQLNQAINQAAVPSGVKIESPLPVACSAESEA